MTFIPNRHFRREYNRLFRKDPTAANLHLLLCEVASRRGEVYLGQVPERKLSELMAARFADPQAYQLPGGTKL